jgi:uncharacterized protein YecE (DUF72 family)
VRKVTVRRRLASEQETLFKAETDYVKQNTPALRELAKKGVWFGTSSWVYPGWRGIVYPGSISTEAALRRVAFREYARVFPTGCADWSFYDFPSQRQIDRYAAEAPDDFRLAFKVTDLITIHRFPKLEDRWGEKAGTLNDDFLSADKFVEFFLNRVEVLGEKLGPMIFEFSPLRWNGLTAKDFLRRLKKFLASLPSGFLYAVEIRNAEVLGDEYFDLLRASNVAHVLNSWSRMPSLEEQWAMAHVMTANFTVVRALLKPGRTYTEAVNRFQPYDKTKEVNEEARRAMREIARKSMASRKPSYIYVNNRLEGSAPFTIAAVVHELKSDVRKS